ncbi:MAG: hypothetical protein ACREPD_19395 [Stenotrophomonas sp.]
MLFLKEEDNRERRARRSRLVDINAAFAGGDPAKKLLKDLE